MNRLLVPLAPDRQYGRRCGPRAAEDVAVFEEDDTIEVIVEDGDTVEIPTVSDSADYEPMNCQLQPDLDELRHSAW
jgi:hypothetical protein